MTPCPPNLLGRNMATPGAAAKEPSKWSARLLPSGEAPGTVHALLIAAVQMCQHVRYSCGAASSAGDFRVPHQVRWHDLRHQGGELPGGGCFVRDDNALQASTPLC